MASRDQPAERLNQVRITLHLPPKFSLSLISSGVYSFSLNGAWISMFIITSEGVMVIDPMNVAHSEAMLAEIRELTSLPIRYLFYSHNHWDHTKGGQVWKNEGATIISHVDAYDWIEENPSEDLVLPDEQWSGDMFQVTLGQTTLELHSTGPSHGQGMTMFVLPREKVITGGGEGGGEERHQEEMIDCTLKLWLVILWNFLTFYIT